MNNLLTILGAGESGSGAALLAKSKGYDVFVSDSGRIKDQYKKELADEGISYEENGHTENKILNTGLIIKSPGIPPTIPILEKAGTLGIEIIDELEFAYRFTSAKIIAITGTNGKTTTTLLTYHLLKEAGMNVGLAGNVGQSLARQLANADEKEYYVVEMSSFQLDGIVTFRPNIAVLLNITPDHLDRYEYSLDNYIDSKFRITKNQIPADHLIFNQADKNITGKVNFPGKATRYKVAVNKEGNVNAFLENGVLHVDDFTVLQEETALRGPHNALNMLCAIAAARIVGVKNETIKAGLKSFKNAPHRLEYVGTINDVAFFNDSKATNVDAVKYALNSFSEPLVWIAGGIDKGNDYHLIERAVTEKVKALVCLGKDNEKLRKAFGEKISLWKETDTMSDAVNAALEYAEAHDVVLLSPACASFDLFTNYIDRGDQFRDVVKKLIKDNNYLVQ